VSGERIIHSEFPTHTHAKLILQAIGSGEPTFRTISNKTGLKKNEVHQAMPTLIEQKRVVEKTRPYSNPRPKSVTAYNISDPYLRFYLRFIAPYFDEIERGRGELVVERIERDWSTWAGLAIEPIIHEGVTRLLPDKKFGDARYAGSYWTQNGQVEVDLVGIDDLKKPSNVSFIGSIKWRNQTFSSKHLKALIEHKDQVPGTNNKTLLVGVSKNGFDCKGLDIKLSAKDIITAWNK
jgi:AAA+ ATPase superfamily predicted ATPase